MLFGCIVVLLSDCPERIIPSCAANDSTRHNLQAAGRQSNIMSLIITVYKDKYPFVVQIYTKFPILPNVLSENILFHVRFSATARNEAWRTRGWNTDGIPSSQATPLLLCEYLRYLLACRYSILSRPPLLLCQYLLYLLVCLCQTVIA